MSEQRVPRKRPAFESTALVRPVAADPRMRRPASTVAGSTLVLLRAAAGALWLLTFAFGWSGWLRDAVGVFSGDASQSSDIPPGTPAELVAIVLAIVAAAAVAEAVLGVLIFRGSNIARVVVMIFSTVSIVTAFVGWWVNGQEIRIHTTYITLALDILILLALSSRNSAAFARRRERTAGRSPVAAD